MTSQQEPLTLTLADGTVWPHPVEIGRLEYKLRYAPLEITRGEQLVLASLCSAYWALTTVTQRRCVEVRRMLKEKRSD